MSSSGSRPGGPAEQTQICKRCIWISRLFVYLRLTYFWRLPIVLDDDLVARQNEGCLLWPLLWLVCQAAETWWIVCWMNSPLFCSPSPLYCFISCPLSQEKRISSLDAANSRLMSALTQVKERYSMHNLRNGLSPTNPTKLSITENGEFKNSSCWLDGADCLQHSWWVHSGRLAVLIGSSQTRNDDELHTKASDYYKHTSMWNVQSFM